MLDNKKCRLDAWVAQVLSQGHIRNPELNHNRMSLSGHDDDRIRQSGFPLIEDPRLSAPVLRQVWLWG